MTTCCELAGPCRRSLGPCPRGWQQGDCKVPSPWVALAARPWLNLLYADIPEPARYYDAHRSIVLRRGLLPVEQRRYLWHELVHADRRDIADQGSPGVEAQVERRAVLRALPLVTLRWAFAREASRHDVAAAVQLPEEWLQFRLDVASPSERALLRRRHRRPPDVA
jgi:hypothetical protein